MIETPFELSLEQIKRIGEVLRQKRKSLKKILDDLADDDISTSTMSNIERGERVSWEKIVIYAEKLGYLQEEIPKLLESEEDHQQLLLQQLKDIEDRIYLVGADNALEKLGQLNLSSANPLMANIEYLIGRCYLKKKRWSTARSHYQKALNVIKRHPNYYTTNLKASCHKDLARMYYFQENDLVKALQHTKWGLDSLVTEEEQQTKYSLSIGKVIYLTKLNQDTETTKKIIEQLLEQKHEIQSIDAVISLREIYAELLNNMKLYEQALESALEGMNLARRNNILDRVLELLTLYGSICINRNDFKQAEKHLILALDMRDTIRKKYQKEYLFVTTLVVLGKLYMIQERKHEARKVLLDAVKLGERTKSKEVLRYHDALVALGDCDLIQNNLKEAVTPYSEALEIAQVQSKAHKNHTLWIEKEHTLWVKLGICYENLDKDKHQECIEKSFQFDVKYIKKGVDNMISQTLTKSAVFGETEPPDSPYGFLGTEPPDQHF